MLTKNFIGWSALALFMVAASTLAFPVLLVLFPSFAGIAPVNYQAMIVVSGVLAFVATTFGFYAFKTSPGKVAAIGGLILFIAVAMLLSFTTITTRIKGHGALQISPALSKSTRVDEMILGRQAYKSGVLTTVVRNAGWQDHVNQPEQYIKGDARS